MDGQAIRRLKVDHVTDAMGHKPQKNMANISINKKMPYGIKP
jgi:hypothetical protein